MIDIQMKCKYKRNKLLDTEHHTVNWDILASGYFGGFLSKCGCLILGCLIFGTFQKMIVLFWCSSNG